MISDLSQSQITALEEIKNGNNVFITGCAGTGKSYLLYHLKKNLNDKVLQITATTGISAINIGGSTIHSWSSLGFEEIPVSEMARRIFSAKGISIRKRIQSTDILAIDEVSMLSKETFENLNQLLQLVRCSSLAFGGLQIILFGDFLQLPPIKSSNYCFESEIWQKAKVKTIILKENFRQSDSRFIQLLDNIRNGKIIEEDIKLLKTRFKQIHQGTIKPTILSTHNYTVETINEEHLKKIKTETYEFDAVFDGKKEKIETLKKNCIAKEKLVLKVGSQVMMLKNTYFKDGIINGSTGIIVKFSGGKKHLPIVLFENGIELEIKYDCWEIGNYNNITKEFEVDATMEQIPLNLAWAITVHKSQGMTLDKVECDLEKSFADGQIYVALSRVKSLEGLYIKSFNANNIKVNKKILEFYNNVELD